MSLLWDGNPIDRARSMAGESLRAYDRRLSLHLILQPYLASQLFKDPVINGQGILGRCLISWPERLAGQRLQGDQLEPVCQSPALPTADHRPAATALVASQGWLT